MNKALNFDLLIPVLIVLAGICVQVAIALFVLQKQKILTRPLNGMEWSRITWIGFTILGIMIICSAMASPVLETYRTFKSQAPALGEAITSTFQRFGKFYLAVSATVILFYLLSLLLLKLLPGEKDVTSSLKEGNLSVAILGGVISTGVAIALFNLLSNILQSMTPVILNFR